MQIKNNVKVKNMQKDLKMCSLFSGIGGLELGLEAAVPGLRTCWQVEQNEFCRRVLAEHWPDAERFDDVRTVRLEDIRDTDVLCGGFPCQDISTLNQTGAGLAGARSGLWWEMHRLISVVLPRIVVAENVPALIGRGLSEVLCALARCGYTCEWDIVSAAAVGARHRRNRIFIIGYRDVTDTQRPRLEKRQGPEAKRILPAIAGGDGRPIKPGVCPVVAGVPRGMARYRKQALMALGNAVVPQVAYQVGLRVNEILNGNITDFQGIRGSGRGV